MADTYRSFRELEEAEREGEAWSREYVDRGSRVLVMAPHGGWIEPFTTEVARAVAGPDLSFYAFSAERERDNERLHITSHRFDEPQALQAVRGAEIVLAIHGERTRDRAFVMVGGRHQGLRRALRAALEEAEVPVEEPREGLGGRHPRNICNRGRAGAGAQLELSEGLRRHLRREPEALERFAAVVRKAFRSVEEVDHDA